MQLQRQSLASSRMKLPLKEQPINLMGLSPKYPTHQDTSKYCSYWYDNDGSIPCQDILEPYLITMADLLRWNPGLGPGCSNFLSGWSYCVEAIDEPVVTSGPTKTTPGGSSPTKGIQTPTPTQPDMVNSCNAFDLVEKGMSCSNVLSKNGITLKQLAAWNPSVVGHDNGGATLKSTTTTTLKTTPTNGIETPSPTQPDMVKNCNEFDFVQKGQNCDALAKANGITATDISKWNAGCGGLWANVWICVSVIGHTPSPTKPSPTNGIETPSPIQGGMVENCRWHQLSISASRLLGLRVNCWLEPSQAIPYHSQQRYQSTLTNTSRMVTNCNKFHEVKKTTPCAFIQDYYKITMGQLAKWNPKVGSSCNALLVGYNVCVGVIGQIPTQPPKQDTTPTPIIPGMIKNWKRFHMVKATTTCDSIQKYYKITMAQIAKWNPTVGAKCTGLWKDYWVCVGA
ncbi:Autolysin [Fusarium acutatum]|uniref:Autolysin n=1 Tax=Fusarium acutatum TaxID=78861 RepID=A0A8H4JP25_9HYPO|nr:Autolysin [Fusarium acutatum]